MIVCDTNLISYLMIPGDLSEVAETVLRLHSEWSAPLLWRSEFRNVLALYMRRGELDVPDALDLVERAARLLGGREYTVPDRSVLELVKSSTCSAYDCEFVALAKELEVPLVTADRAILRDFPDIAVSPRNFRPRDG